MSGQDVVVCEEDVSAPAGRVFDALVDPAQLT